MSTREREVIAAARAVAVRYQQPGEDVVARFERVAEMFRRETGFLAPGKDEPAAGCAGEESARERDDAWNAWSRKPVDDLIASLAAHDALLVEGSASSEYPECSGDPACCPENEGYGCCKPNPSSEGAEAGAPVSDADVARGMRVLRLFAAERGDDVPERGSEDDAIAAEAVRRIISADRAAQGEHEQSGDYWIESERIDNGTGSNYSIAISNVEHGECIIVYESESHDSEKVARRIIAMLNGEHEQRSCEGSNYPEAQQAQSWLAVVSVLNEVAPAWQYAISGTGCEKACAAIRALAQRCEGSERRPIADEVVLPDLPTPSVYDRGRFGVMFSADQMQAYARAALESALPRGLPAGSDAKAPFALPVEVVEMRAHENYKAYALKDVNGMTICDTLNSDLIEVHDEIDDDGAYSWDEVGRRNMEYIAAALNRAATAEQPPCGQDARDAARYRWLRDNVCPTGTTTAYPYAHLRVAMDEETEYRLIGTRSRVGVAAIDFVVDAAIAAQQRQGGGA